MSPSRRLRAVKVLKAVSSPVRLNILNLLFEKGTLSYTEMMSALKMNPSRDAGRFAYHLKFLLKVDLVEADVETRKYRLTRLGEMVINVTSEIESKSVKQKRTLVRTSRFSLADFDVNKIVDSLMKEADMPVDLAQKVAKEAEKRLLKPKTKYLTAPLIREVVNAILIERGLEKYRHRLTRLGLPVYDVASLVGAKSKTSQGSISISEKAGKVVLNEYTLLNVLPRDIADAHLSGLLHINCLDSWVLKPSEVLHDLRFILRKGLNLEEMNVLHPSFPPPRSFESALSMVFDFLLHSSREVSDTQTLEYFNIFLAPFIKDLSPSKVKENLRSHLHSVSQHMDLSFGLELVTPAFIAEKEAVGPYGKSAGNYEDFEEESRLLASLVLEVFVEESKDKPLNNPKIIVKMRPEIFSNEGAQQILLQAHQLASEKGVPHFANLAGKRWKEDVFSASGYQLKADMEGDWEIDTLRTGNIGSVTVNLPRIAYECRGDFKRFPEILIERLEIADRALEIKHRALKHRGKSLIPFLTQKINGDDYFRLDYSSRIINFAGLKEAAEAFCGKGIFEGEEPLKCVEQITRWVTDFIHKAGKRRRKRLLPAILPDVEASKRLARLDIERYGVGKVRFSGTRKNPFYSTFGRLNLQNEETVLDFLKLEKKMDELHVGGNLTITELGDGGYQLDQLVALTRRIVESYGIEFFAYNRNLTYCVNCSRSWLGQLHKCPSCGATSTLTRLNKYGNY